MDSSDFSGSADDPAGGHRKTRWNRAASLAALADLGAKHKYRAGTVLINQGDTGGSLYIILSGAVRAFVDSPTGRVLTLNSYNAGEYVGEMALDGGLRSASIITTEPTECSVVSREVLLAHIGTDPDFALDLIMRLIQRARMATESARGLALLDVYGRVRKLLEDESIPEPDGTQLIGRRLTHQDIADQVGASREMISKILKELAVGGYIRVDNKRIRILRPLPPGW